MICHLLCGWINKRGGSQTQRPLALGTAEKNLCLKLKMVSDIFAFFHSKNEIYGAVSMNYSGKKDL